MSDPIVEWARDPVAAAVSLAESPVVPGVAVAGVVDGEVRVGAGGNAEPDTVFRPGSITKLLTATLVAQCAEDGLLALDDPIAAYLPDLHLDGPHTVNVRHLVTHCSGIDAGDLFVDTGDDDAALDRYVELLQGASFLFPPGATFSYCNAGFVLAGKIVAQLRGGTWEDAMRRHLFEPLGMEASDFAATDASFQTGTFLSGGTVRALGPAGGTLVSTAGDLGRFLADHMARPERAWMRDLAAPAPGGVRLMHGAGAGWMVWQGSTRIGGANPGHSGYLALDPAAKHGVVVLTNSEQGVNAASAILDGAAPALVDPAPPLSDFGGLEGEYASHIMRVNASVVDGSLTISYDGASAPLTPVDAQTFQSMLGPVAFFDGLARWRMRVLRKVS